MNVKYNKIMFYIYIYIYQAHSLLNIASAVSLFRHVLVYVSVSLSAQKTARTAEQGFEIHYILITNFCALIIIYS